MARVKIDPPEVYHFETEIPVRITDINYGGHVGNDAFLSILHEARIKFLSNFGYSEINIEGKSLIMADSAIIYKAEGFYGDIFKIKIAVSEFSNFGFDLIYEITKDSDILVIIAKTGMVFFDYNTRKITSVPEKFKNLFQQASGF
jgi:acyl-CoA thioester hydrolase